MRRRPSTRGQDVLLLPRPDLTLFRSLRPYHLLACLAHLSQAIAALTLGLCSTDSCSRFKAFKIPQVHNRVSWNDDPHLTAYVTDHLYAFPFVPALSSIAFISAAFHLLNATLPCSIPPPQNPRRWVEYALSSSVMIVGILMLSGIWDVTTLIVLGLCNGVMCLMGIVAERSWAIGQKDYLSFSLGGFLGLLPWSVILGNLFHGSPPAFVYVVIFGYMALFCLFPTVFLWQWSGSLQDATDKAPRAEKLYLFLSFSAKALLLWGVIGGINQPNRYAD